MNIERMSSRVLLLCAVVALLAYGASERDMSLGMVGGLAGFLGWFLYARWNAALPRWVTGIVMIVALGWTLLRLSHIEGLISTFTGLLAVLIVLKLWERRRPREDGQLLTLSLFLTIGATLNDNGLLVGLLLIVQTPLALAGVLLLHLRFPAMPPGKAASSPRLARAFTLLVAVFGVTGFILAAGVFVFIPRGIGGDQLGSFGRTGSAMATGLSDRVELGRAGLISQSQATVLELSIRDSTGQLLGGDGEIHYLRATSLDHYDQGQWSRSPAGIRDESLEPGQRENLLWPPRQARLIEQRVRIRSASADPPIPAISTPVWVSWEQPGRLIVDQATRTLARNGAPGPLAYTVASWVGSGFEESPERRAEISFPNERITRLAREVLRRAQIEPDPRLRPVSDDPAAARSLESFMRLRRTYTLDLQAPPGGMDPTEWFIFDAKAGHCEYFASSLAAMCRSVGIEARVVTGFVASEWDASRQVYVVRRSHAHAWVEILAGQDRWLTYDATPPADLAATHDAGRGVMSRMARWLDGLESVWAASVVGFDQFAQGRLLGQRPGHPGAAEQGLLWLRRTLRDSTSASMSGGSWLEGVEPGTLASIGIGSGLVIIGGVLYWRSRRRLRHRSAGELVDRWLRVCAHIGLVKPAWQPPLAFAKSIRGTHPELAVIGREVTLLEYRARFGGEPSLPEETHAMRTRLQGVFSDVRAGRAGQRGRGRAARA